MPIFCKERFIWKYSYGEAFLCPYELAVRELIVKFEHIISEHRENDLYSPIEQVSGRVKKCIQHSG